MKTALNLLGILIYFLIRYANRTDQTSKPSITFWFKDNWPEFVGILAFDIVLMLLLMAKGVVIDLEKMIPSLPDGLSFVGDLAICFVIGAVLAHAAYELFRTKIKK